MLLGLFLFGGGFPPVSMSACIKGFVCCLSQICDGTINSLIPQRDTIKTRRDSGLTSLAFKEHREMLVVHFPAEDS